MSILSTVKKGYLYMKTSTGYLKLLPRTLASLVSLDNGNSVETEISNIKSAAKNLSSTVSGHTTTLSSHGSSISAIKTKTDALKNAANKTVANNLTTTADGYVLDARMGMSLQNSITKLKSTFANVQEYTPKLLTANGREITQDKTNGYAYGYCMQIGNIVLLYFQVKTKIIENGERAKISLPTPKTSASYGATFVVSESGGLTDGSAGRGEIREDGMISLLSEDEGNGNIGYSNVYWKNTGQVGYIKMSGFYFV